MLLTAAFALPAFGGGTTSAPFKHRVESYRADDESGTVAFVIHLEQPFLANEFEKSNFLRAAPSDERSHLIYPLQTRFEKKHAAFFGRLKGAAPAGPAKVRIDYETVTEALDGSRAVQASSIEVEVPDPQSPGGDPEIYRNWARMQTAYFSALLKYYPNETFLQYVVLQSAERHGIAPVQIAAPPESAAPREVDLFSLLGSSAALHEVLQKRALSSEVRAEPQDTHISALSGPATRKVDYKKLIEKRREQEPNPPPPLPELAKLIPVDQYAVFVDHAGSLSDLEELLDGLDAWRMSRPAARARDAEIVAHLEQQLCVSLPTLAKLSDDGVIRAAVLTGGSLPVSRGVDLSLICALAKPDEFATRVGRGRDEAATQPGVERRSFSYRGHTIDACYSPDRRVSVFAVQDGDVALLANSHVGIRRLIDVKIGSRGALVGADDFRYFHSLMATSDAARGGFAYASDAFLRRSTSPAERIGERRRRQCENNLRMLGNAALFFRLENGRSPADLSEMVVQRYVNLDKLICPHGGAYSFDAQQEAGACSIHNRLAFVTPTIEVETLQVSAGEKADYAKFREQHEAYWCDEFGPMAVRWSGGDAPRITLCTLPPTGSSLLASLRQRMVEKPLAALDVATPAGAFVTLQTAPGRARLGEYLRLIPGMAEALRDDPTLTDLQWLGDRIAIHVFDSRQILEFDPARVNAVNLIVPIGEFEQTLVGGAIAATSLPLCVVLEVEDADKAQRLLDLLSSRIVVQDSSWMGLETGFDAYRLADYRAVARFVLTYRMHVLKVRLHVALVRGQLLAATTAHALQAAIDARLQPAPQRGDAPPQHLAFQWESSAMQAFRETVRGYWQDKARAACHANVIPIEMLARLYGISGAAAAELTSRVLGERHFCPQGGAYDWCAEGGGICCSVHGNRVHSRQSAAPTGAPTVEPLWDRYEQLRGTIRFATEATYTEISLQPNKPGGTSASR